jgi:hypothetical protein
MAWNGSNVEYLSELEVIVQTALGYESGGFVNFIPEKSSEVKIHPFQTDLKWSLFLDIGNLNYELVPGSCMRAVRLSMLHNVSSGPRYSQRSGLGFLHEV